MSVTISPPAAARPIKHLPYEVDPRRREGFYENYWKLVSLRLLLKHLRPAGKTVLDYGCGRGETLGLFGDAGFQVTGTDMDPECVRLSSRYGRAYLLDGEKPLAQFGEKSFDVVTCFHVLEHVENPKEVLTNLAAIARDYLVLAVPNLRQLHRLLVRNVSLSGFNEGHLQSWDHWHFRNLAERHCGLELVEWASDATVLPLVSNFCQKLLGARMTIALETGLFRTIFPLHCISVLGLFRVPGAGGARNSLP